MWCMFKSSFFANNAVTLEHFLNAPNGTSCDNLKYADILENNVQSWFFVMQNGDI